MERARVEVSRRMPFAARTVWELLGNFGKLDWIPVVTRVELLGNGVGAVRRVHTASGHVDEQLDAYDERVMRFTYSIPGPMPYPVREYRVQVGVDAHGADACTVRWSADFLPQGVSRAEAERLMASVYASIGDWIEQALCRRLSSRA